MNRLAGHRCFCTFLALLSGSLLGSMSLHAQTPSFLSQVQQWGTQEISVRSWRAHFQGAPPFRPFPLISFSFLADEISADQNDPACIGVACQAVLSPAYEAKRVSADT